MEYIHDKEEESRTHLGVIEKKMKITDFIAMVIGVSGTAIALYEYELFYDFINPMINQGKLEAGGNDNLKNEPDENFYLRIINTILTVILCALIFYHYILHLQISKIKNEFDNLETMFTSKLYIPLTLENLYCAVYVPPRVNYGIQFSQYEGSYVYSINMLISLAMLGRVYLIWRYFLQYSVWKNYRSESICKSCGCKSGTDFAVKAELKERPYTVVAVALTISIFFFGIALRNAERPFEHYSQQNWDYIWNGMWCIIITMTTVGYGDYFAVTHFGRIISVLACFWGTFLISLMVLSLTISSEFTPQESKSFNKIKSDEAEEEVKEKAANAIKFGIRLKIFLRKNPNASEKSKAKVINEFKRALIEFRKFSMKLKASEQDAPIELVLSKLNDKVSYVLDKIKNDCYVYKSINSKLELSENNQKIIDASIDELIKLNELVISKVKK